MSKFLEAACLLVLLLPQISALKTSTTDLDILNRQIVPNVEMWSLPMQPFVEFGGHAPKHKWTGPLTMLLLQQNEDSVKVNKTDAQPAMMQQEIDVIKVNNTDSGTTDKKLTPHSWFAITFSLAFIIKGLCMGTSVVQAFTPIPQVKSFEVNANTGNVDAAPFFACCYCGAQWCFYGTFAYLVTGKSGFLVLLYSNICCCLLGAGYIVVFWKNCRSKRSMDRLHFYSRVAVAIGIVQIASIVTLPRENSLFFAGLISSVCSIVGGTAMLATVPIIIETGSSDVISREMLISNLIGNVLWLACGIMLWDEWICVPNLVGFLANCTVATLCIRYPMSCSSKAKLAEQSCHSPILSTGRITDRLPSLSSEHFTDEEVEDPAPALSSSSSWDYGAMGETGCTMGETGGTF